MESGEQRWLEEHEGRWGRAGVATIARSGVSPFAWDFPSNVDRARVQELALERLKRIDVEPFCDVCENTGRVTSFVGCRQLEPNCDQPCTSCDYHANKDEEDFS